MRLLLDTHAVIWAMRDPDRLTPAAARAITDTDNEVLVSAASAWEIATKTRIGKLPAGEAVVAGLRGAMRTLDARELSITLDHGLAAGAFDSAHRDPFDRMLAAQAMIEGATLVTADSAFDGFPVAVLW